MFNMTENLKYYETFRSSIGYVYEISDAVVKYVRDTFKALGSAVFIYLIICVMFYIINARYAFINVNKFIKSFRRVLIVTAHPDDECMFFGPLILNLVKTDCKIFLLCLSNGDHYKIGHKRKQELWNGCEVLGIPSSNIVLCRNPFMIDDPNVLWRKEEVSAVISEHIESLHIDTLVTFDEDGVSGHYNHISIYNAVCFMILKKQLPSYTKVYVLESVNIFRKYTNALDAFLTYVTSSYICQVGKNEHSIIVKAMKQHESQYVWFRNLYINFSRYAFLNSFRTVDSSNAFLEMDDLMNDERL